MSLYREQHLFSLCADFQSITERKPLVGFETSNDYIIQRLKSKDISLIIYEKLI